MVTETDRAWLAGIIDGEGCIAFFSNQEKNGCTKLKPSINFVNTDMDLVNKALKILTEAGINVYIAKRVHKNERHHDVIEVKASALPQIQKWIELVLPYLQSIKRAKGEILLRYVVRRQERLSEKGRNDLATYTEEDWKDLAAFRSSSTTREELHPNCVTMI